MRFSTLVTFILPLSALAAPSLVKRAPAANEDELNKERQSFADSLLATNTTLHDIFDPFEGAPLPAFDIGSLLDEAKKAQKKIETAINTGTKILPLILAKEEVDPNDQLTITQNVLDANAIISSFQTNFEASIDGFDTGGSVSEHNNLTKLIDTAVTEVGSATESGLRILHLQGLDALLAQVVPGSEQ